METTEQYAIGQEIDNEDYHAGPGVSNSALKVLRNDPREYHWQYVLGNRDRERKDYFDFGSAVHDIALLGSHANICVIPQDVLSASGSRAGKAWKEFEADNVGKLLLKQADFDSVMACVKSLHDHPLAGKLLACEGPAERMFTHDDPLLELRLKCKPDKLALTPKGTVIVDLKTTESVNPSAFVRSIVSYDYDCQRYFYERVLKARGMEIVDFVFVAVSKSRPHCVNCFSISDDDMTTAADMTENSLQELAERYRANDWQPSFTNKVVRLSLPRYAQNRSDYRL